MVIMVTRNNVKLKLKKIQSLLKNERKKLKNGRNDMFQLVMNF